MSDAAFLVDSDAFDLGAPDAPVAALCLHGLTGTPYEVRPLGEALARAGVRAIGPPLPGHNRTPEELSRVRHVEWLDAVRESLRQLREAHRRVAVVGLSLGGLLALALAAETPVDAIAVVGTPLRLRIPLLPLLPAVRRVKPFVYKSAGSDIRDAEARARHPSYDRMPLASVEQLLALQGLVRRRLPQVRAPILVAHGLLDATAHPDDARAIMEGVGSSSREILWLESSGHVVPVDRDGPRLAAAIAAHCARLA